jgi:NitT/TauT family transport system substrate-binding protein
MIREGEMSTSIQSRIHGFVKRAQRSGAVIGLAATLSVACAAGVAAEPRKVTIGYSPILDSLTAFIAKDKGLFAKHGIDATLTLVTLNSNIPAGIMSKSLDLGSVSTTVFVQAVDGGLDLQVVQGATMLPNKNALMAYVTRSDVPFDGVKSLEGKKISMPGLGASVDILFQKWMADQGGDPKKVNYIELASSQATDALRGKVVDGSVVVEPFLTRVVQSGSGKIVHRLTDGLPGPTLAISYIAERGWAQKNKETLADVRAALREAMDWAQANPKEARALLTTYLKLPTEVVDALPLPLMQEKVTPADLSFWIDAMKAQGRLTTTPDPVKLIAP